MVDFNNETTVGIPASDIVRVLILQARTYLFDAIEDYYKNDKQGIDIGLHVIQARLLSLFILMQAELKRKMEPEPYQALYDKAKLDLDFWGMLDTALFLNEWLDGNQLIRIDMKERYDPRRVEKENKAKSL